MSSNARDAAAAEEPLLEVRGLAKHYPLERGVLRRSRGWVKALDGVSFTVARGKTLALVGESGSGKTTLARSLLRLVEPSAGEAILRLPGAPPRDLFRLGPRELRALRRHVQIVVQDPEASLNPRLAAGAMVGEVLEVHGLARGAARARRTLELLERVGLSSDALARHPHEFSGGQRQRLAIARALACEPSLLVCDEPVSALDVSVQAQILNLFADLQAELSLALLFISHDLGVVRHVAHEIAVMYAGRIVERGPAADVLERPAHPYTQALVRALPALDPARRRERTVLAGEPPSPARRPSGCAFHPRCPLAEERCRREDPKLARLSDGREAACHLLR